MAALRGVAYERACLHTLQHWLRMQVYRTGGANDRGMDLCGWWAPHALPHAPDVPDERLRVVVQCKAEAKPTGPGVVRELEGTLVRAAWDTFAPFDARQQQANNAMSSEAPLVGVLATLSGFTKQALLHARTSRIPLLFLHLTSPHPAFADLRCAGLLWNDALAQGALQGRFDIGWIETPRSRSGKSTNQVVLYRDGEAVA